MISVSKLLCDLDAEGDGLRYDAANESTKCQIRDKKQRRPVVVWNVTKQCNLYCATVMPPPTRKSPRRASTAEGKRCSMTSRTTARRSCCSPAASRSSVQDLEELVAYANDVGVRPVLSTNGTLITEESRAVAERRRAEIRRRLR